MSETETDVQRVARALEAYYRAAPYVWDTDCKPHIRFPQIASIAISAMTKGVTNPNAPRDQFAAQAFGPILTYKIAQFGHPCDPVYHDAAREAYKAADEALRAMGRVPNLNP